MQKINIKILSLVLLVLVILIANNVFNNAVFNQSNSLQQKKDTIFLALMYLDELNYQSIIIDDIEAEYIDNQNDSLFNIIIGLKKQEFELIKKTTTLLMENVIINKYNRDLVVLDKLEIDFNDHINNQGKLIDWINRNEHKTLIINSSIDKLKKILFNKREEYTTQYKIRLQSIFYTDILQTISIIVLTVLIVIILYRDNLKQKHLTSELKQINLTKDKFFSILSHDLRNPFNVLIGFSQHLLDNFDNHPADKTKKIIESISQTSKKTYELLDNLLDWSSIQTGKIQPAFKQFSTKQIITEVIELLKSSASQKYIDLEAQIEEDVNIYADPEMIKTILRNLITNSIKFTDINGKITLSTMINSSNVYMSVQDNGVGIDMSNLDKLFRMETKLSTTGTRGEKGTGLGLLLCKELIELNKGTIKAESIIGKGSKFTLILPKIAKNQNKA